MARKRRQSIAPVGATKARRKARSVPANGHDERKRPSVERLDVRHDLYPIRYVVGVDPGGRTSGVTRLTVDGERLRWMGSEMMPRPGLIRYYDTHLLAVEAPNVVYSGMGLATGVLMTAFTAGEWYAAGPSIGVSSRVVLTPQSVRIALCGRAGASDADVARALAHHVDGIPKRTNTHVRDAAAVALVGWWRVRAELERRRAATRPDPPWSPAEP